MMKLTRRNLLLSAGLNIPAMIACPSLSNAQSPFKSFQLILSDVTADSPPDGLLAILEPFVDARVPVCCMVRSISNAGALEPESPLAYYMRRFISDYPDQIEVAIETPTLTDRPYCFQGRLATRARQTLIEGLVSAPADERLARSVLTLASFGPPLQYQPGGVRVAGFRTALSLPRSGKSAVDSVWDGGVLHLFGGMHFELDEPFERVASALRSSLRDDPRTLLNISLKGLTPENSDAAVENMVSLASLISALASDGQLVATTPGEFRVRASPNPDTVIGLRLDVPGLPNDPVSAPALELARWLRSQNYKFTIAGNAAGFWQDNITDICSTEGRNITTGQNPCRVIGDGAPNVEDAGWPAPKISMVPSPGTDPIAGLDRYATLHPARVAYVELNKSAAQNLADLRILEDTVLVLDPRSYGTAAQRLKTTAIITGLAQRRGFEVTDVSSFADRVQLQDPIRRVYDQTKEVMHRERAAFAAQEQLDTEMIFADAELAWCYLRDLVNPVTGLIPSTAFRVDGETSVYSYATMWDVGSQIFGMIAAVELNLTTLPQINDWAGRLVEGLPTVLVQGSRLPSSIFHTNHDESPDPSFTCCDVGRLLNAFDRLRSFLPALKGVVDEKVANWDLHATIRDGHMQDITERDTFDRFKSHCTQYAARGYAAFGISADSPYALADWPVDADTLFELLFGASKIGSIGAEPLLLEAVELGLAPASKFLADMLFAAQFEDYRSTGKMRCVSESPLEVSPWFTYQGYNIGNVQDQWNVQVLSSQPRYTNPEFLRSIELVSVKAAYLWAATYRHRYSRDLVNYVRSRARIENFGFASGIYRETGIPMKDYSDLNTNSIILEAAASILK